MEDWLSYTPRICLSWARKNLPPVWFGARRNCFLFNFLFQFLQAHNLIFGRHHVIQKRLLQNQIKFGGGEGGALNYHSLQLKRRFIDKECLLTCQCTITSGLDLIGRLCIIIVVFPFPDGWVRVPRKFDCLIKTLCRRTLQSFSFFFTPLPQNKHPRQINICHFSPLVKDKSKKLSCDQLAPALSGLFHNLFWSFFRLFCVFPQIVMVEANEVKSVKKWH